ncbi:unnamed protein product, partial [Effrenium voratum]
ALLCLLLELRLLLLVLAWLWLLPPLGWVVVHLLLGQQARCLLQRWLCTLLLRWLGLHLLLLLRELLNALL